MIIIITTLGVTTKYFELNFDMLLYKYVHIN